MKYWGAAALAIRQPSLQTVLNAEGTPAQHNVVLSNAALALRTINPHKSFADCFYEAEESLLSKKALQSFKNLINAN